MLEKQANIKGKVIGTLMYPMFVIVLAFFIIIIMLTFVFPAFKDMFAQQEKALPWITSMMILAGDYLKTYWLLLFMIATGEQSGRLGDMLEKGVNFLDRTLDAIIDTLTKMIEPIMLIVIGSIVLVMALALYLPLFQSYMN